MGYKIIYNALEDCRGVPPHVYGNVYYEEVATQIKNIFNFKRLPGILYCKAYRNVYT